MVSQRIKVFFWLFLLAQVGVLGRIFWWQIVVGKELRKGAQKQRLKKILLVPTRGRIYARDGYPLALSQTRFLAYVYRPQLRLSAEELAAKLAPILKVEIGSISGKLKSGRRWIPLAERLTSSQTEALLHLGIEGLGIEKREIRFYPEASLAAHLLGFVGQSKEGIPRGWFGVEGFWDQQLQGVAGAVVEEEDIGGRPIFSGMRIVNPAKPGLDLHLYIDRSLQFVAEEELKKGVSKYQAKGGWVVILDPQTGGLLAAAAVPNFDPNYYFQFPDEVWKNPIVSESFEPGSIFKPLIMAAALEEGVVDSQTRCPCEGPRRIGEYVIRTWNDKYYPNSSMEDILVHSDNVGMVFVIERLGKKKTLLWLGKFGFGEKSGVDLQGEINSQLKPEARWYPIDLATVGFGQGIAVTPIQMVRAFAALANGGWLVKPRVVAWLEDEKGKHIKLKGERRKILSEKTVVMMRRFLVAAVEKGEARWAKPPGLRVAGKTGTAQIPIKGHYDDEKTIASFIGFWPVDKPRLVMLVSLREPAASPWGAETAAPVWFRIMERIAYYLK